MTMRLLSLFVLVGSSLFLVGCGGERALSTPKTVAVRGNVSFKGSPVPGVYFTLEPTGVDGVPARAVTDDNGNFELRTFSNGDDPDGAVLGEYVIEFQPVPKTLPDNVNERRIKVSVKGEEDDLKIDIEP